MDGNDRLAEQIALLIENAKQHIVTTVNSTMTATYYEIGRMIVEHEQQGKRRAEYGAKLLPDLAKRLTKRFGKGFSRRNLTNMRQFYLVYSPILQTASGKSETPSRFSEDTSAIWQTASAKSEAALTLGQMQMYVNYYDRVVKLPNENPTVGILLCKKKNDAVVEMTLPKDNTQIFASNYELVLPDKEALMRLLVDE